MGFAAPFIPAIVGAGAGAMAKGAAAGTLLASIGPTAAAALGAGGTSLLMGNDPLTAGLDLIGGGGIGGAIDDLARAGATSAVRAAGTGPATALAQGVSPAVAGINASVPTAITGGGAGALGALKEAGAGLGSLFKPGGMDAFKAATGSSALSSVGLPAAGLAIQGLGGLTMPMNAPSIEEGYKDYPFTPIAELRRRNESMGYAQGGIAELNPMRGVFDARNAMPEYTEHNNGYKKGGYLNGPGDGMSDDIPATIEGKQPARLADGEFVIPADVVSHLGNGSTKAGAQRLYSMMSKVRKARTGNPKQGKQIKAEKYMPA